MSKEFHVFTHRDTDYEQAFVFEIERHEKEQLIEFRDLLMVTTTKHGELKTRIQFDQMIQSVITNEGGTVSDSRMNVIVDMFSELLPEEKKNEIMEDIDEKRMKNISAEELIKASEYAVIIEQSEEIKYDKDKGTTQET